MKNLHQLVEIALWAGVGASLALALISTAIFVILTTL